LVSTAGGGGGQIIKKNWEGKEEGVEVNVCQNSKKM